MATPRKRYFRVADSILREQWDDATLATAIRLMAWLNQRWARDGIADEERGRAVIGETAAMEITRIRRPHVALQRLARLPLAAGWSTARAWLDDVQRPSRVTIDWPKYAEFQDSKSEVGETSRPRRGKSLPPPHPHPASAEETPPAAPSAVVAPKAKRAPRDPSKASIGQVACGMWVDALRQHRGLDAQVMGRTAGELKRVAEAMGVERLGAALEAFFTDPEVKDHYRVRGGGLTLATFLAVSEFCDQRAQIGARLRVYEAAREADAAAIQAEIDDADLETLPAFTTRTF